MLEYINLFKALPVEKRTSSFSTDYLDRGVLVENSIIDNYGKRKISSLIGKLIPSDSQMNKTFHKSWQKVRDASIEQLVVEQLIHYFTTYGFERLGFYNEDSVYIPNEQLHLEAKGGITFLVLKGITSDEIIEKINTILTSGIALSDSDLDDLITVIKDEDLEVEPAECANREMRVRLYDLLKINPVDPVEFLRLQVYRVTQSTLLIKNRETVQKISESVKTDVFRDYKPGLAGLATIFYRFKPLFLAFKNKKSASTINRIRKLAVKNHRPVPEDYLANVTKHLRNGTLDTKQLHKALEKTNVFRKVKLIQALNFYEGEEARGVVYSVRNGKAFVSTTKPAGDATEAMVVILDSLSWDLARLEGKKVYMDANLAVPTSGKMFVGDVPVGSSFEGNGSLVLGVSWSDVKGYRIDLDLSIVSIGGKIGWDGGYRNDNFLFSGDITSAPHGATEAHLVRQGAGDGIYSLYLNYFNGYDSMPEVPFTLFVADETEFKRKKHSVVSKDNMLFWADSSIDPQSKQKSIGVLKIKDGIKKFYLFESKMGHGMSARRDSKSLNMIDYYDKYLDSLLSLRNLLEWVGVTFVSSPEDADIDLSLKSLTKDALIDLLVGKSS